MNTLNLYPKNADVLKKSSYHESYNDYDLKLIEVTPQWLPEEKLSDRKLNAMEMPDSFLVWSPWGEKNS